MPELTVNLPETAYRAALALSPEERARRISRVVLSSDWKEEPELTKEDYAAIGEGLAQLKRGERIPGAVVTGYAPAERKQPVLIAPLLLYMSRRGEADFDAAVRFPRYNHAMNPLSDRITMSHNVCHGKPCVRGLRYPVEFLLDLLASGMTEGEILADYDDLERDDLRAVLQFAARLTRVQKVTLAL